MARSGWFIRLLKLSFSIALVWALFVLAWFTLPSTVPTDGHTIRMMESGRPVYRVYDVRKLGTGVLYPDHKAWGESHFGMKFYLHRDEASGSLNLMYGGYEDFVDDILGTRRPLHEIRANVSLSIPDRYTPTTVSEPLILNVPIMSDRLGLLPPHLAVADAVMLSHWIHRHSGRVPTRIRIVPSEGRIEIWPDHAHWKNSKDTPLNLSPIITITIHNKDENATFHLPPTPISSSPSFFYSIRLFLLPFVECLSYIPIDFDVIASMLISTWPVLGIVLLTLGVLLITFLVVILANAIGFIIRFGMALWRRKNEGKIRLGSDDHDGDSIDTVVASDLESQNGVTPNLPSAAHLDDGSQSR